MANGFLKTMYKDKIIGIVIPYFNDLKHIHTVIKKIPDFIDIIIIVDDKSSESLPTFKSEKIKIIRNIKNLGVGGATITGFKKILDFNPFVVVKMDADDQMDPRYLPDLLDPIIDGKSEYSKGNRYFDIEAIKKIPIIRRIGNLGLSFLTKIATGYWNNFDPTNGYFAIKASYLKKINLVSLHKRFFFETSLIAQLYFHDVRIMDVPMHAIYKGEKSSLKVWKELFRYPLKLSKIFIKRILLHYFIYDFNMASLYIVIGVPLFLFGTIYGLYVWISNAIKNVLTSTGTIMFITLAIILGFQLILQAIQIDMERSPKCSEKSVSKDI